MDPVGGRLLGTLDAATQMNGSGMPVGEIAPVAAPARFDAAMHRANLDYAAGVDPAFAGRAQSSDAPIRVAQADTSLQVAQSPVVAPETTVTGNPSFPAPAPVQASDTSNVLERDRRALDLAPLRDTSATGEGDSILDGLTRLRSVFDGQQGRLVNAMNQPVMDANSMVGLQVEVINFSMLVDVASKLTGKSTSALETLMKGQ